MDKVNLITYFDKIRPHVVTIQGNCHPGFPLTGQ